MCTLTGTALPRTALAEPTVYDRGKARILLLPSTGAERPPERIVTEVAAALRNTGTDVLAFDEAKALFEARHSSQAEEVDASDVDAVAREAQAALLMVATGRTSRAKTAIAEVMNRAERALESLNRTNDSARNVLNACLYLVRSMLDADNEAAARQKVVECRRMVPDIQPDPLVHPPGVMRLYREAGADLAEKPTGELTIRSTPSGCDAFINGRRLGVTPYVLSELPAGEYRVQVECETPTGRVHRGRVRRGRVHRVLLAAQPQTLNVDARFDGVIQTKEGLGLKYDTPEDENERRGRDAPFVARLLDSTHVMAVTPTEGKQVRIDLMDDNGLNLASAWVTTGLSSAALRDAVKQAVAALVDGQSGVVEGDSVVEQARWEPPQREPEAQPEPVVEETVASAPQPLRRTRRHWIPLGIMTTIGVGALGLAGAMTFELGARADAFRGYTGSEPDFLQRQADLDQGRKGPLIAAGVGAATLSASLPFWMDRPGHEPALRWWHWAVGGAGAALAAGGSYLAAKTPACVDGACTRREPDRVVGGVLLLTAAPMLATPLTAWLMERSSVSVSLGPGSATVHGTF